MLTIHFSFSNIFLRAIQEFQIFLCEYTKNEIFKVSNLKVDRDFVTSILTKRNFK